MQDFEKQHYTLQQIADNMGRSRSTLNEWRKRFDSYIPSVGQGRQRRYKREALNIFEAIARLKDANETNDQIKEYLDQITDEIIIEDKPMENDTPPPLLRQMFDSYNELLDQNEELRNQMQQMQEEQQAAKNREERLLQKLDSLTTKFDEAELARQEKEKQENQKEEQKSFWQKIFGN